VSDDRREEPFEDSLLDLPLGPGDDADAAAGAGSGEEPSPAGPRAGADQEPFAGWDAPPVAGPAPDRGAEAVPPAGREPKGRRNRLTLILMIALVLILLLALAGLAGYLLPRPAPALVRVEPAMVDFGTRSVVGGGGSIEVTLTSSGERPATIERAEVVAAQPESGGEVVGSPDAFRIASDACSGATVAPEKTCVVAVAFAPAAAGVQRATLRLEGDFANAPLDLPLLGEGIAPHVRVDRRQIEFAGRPVGAEPAQEVVTLENDGTAPLDLDAVVVTGPAADDFAVAASGCTRAPLEPGASCPVSVAFAPVVEGARQATLVLRPGPGSRGMEAPDVALSGTGLAPEPTGRLAVVAPAGATGSADMGIDYGPVRVGGGAERTIHLVNRGDLPLKRAALTAATGEGPFSVSANGCPDAAPLAPAATCDLTVRFAPTVEGTATGTVRVGAPGATTGTAGIELSLRGEGVMPRLVPKPTALDFGESRVGREGPVQKLTFSSTGTGAVAVDAVALGGSDPGAFAVRSDGCSGKTLAPGASCTVEVGFQPRQEGVQSARLVIRTPSLGENPTAALRGAGAAPRIAFAPRSLAFDRVPATRSASRSLTVTSAGRAPLEIRRVDVVGADADAFAVTKEDCTQALSLAPGDTCQVSVRFAPATEGDKSARLVFTHDGEGSPAEVRITGTAMPAPVPRFAVSPGQVRFGAVPVGSRSAIETVTVKNAGSDRLVLRAASLEGASAGDFRIVPGSCEGAPYITPGSECTIGVRFTPSAAGARAAVLVIPHNAAGGAGRVRLSGSGSAGAGGGAP